MPLPKLDAPALGEMLRRSRTTMITLDHSLVERPFAKQAKRASSFHCEVIIMRHSDGVGLYAMQGAEVLACF